MKILVINSGSSSLKFQLLRMPTAEVLASGLVERIGEAGSQITFDTGREKIVEQSMIEDHHIGLHKVVALLLDKKAGILESMGEVAAVGHRVVHGGSLFGATTVIDASVKEGIRKLFSLAPLHNPANLTGIEVAEQIFAKAKQVAVFDTAFFQSIPEKAFRYAIPNKFYEEDQIRLYGFHGTSHKYVSERARKYLGPKSNNLISIHLGNGCSMTAIKDGKAVDHSMGFSPSTGLIMGTRAGDIDHSIVFYLVETLGFEPKEVDELLNKKSGMLGLTGHSDLRDIQSLAEKGDLDCRLALAMNAYRIQKYIGAYSAVLNGLDAIIFTAGIGENSSLLRQMVCADMDFFGIGLDVEKNAQRKEGLRALNTEESKVKILVVPTNEELEIARQTYAILN